MVCFDVTFLEVSSYGYDNGKDRPTRGALIGGVADFAKWSNLQEYLGQIQRRASTLRTRGHGVMSHGYKTRQATPTWSEVVG